MEIQLTDFNRYGHMWIQFIQSLNRSHFNVRDECHWETYISMFEKSGIEVYEAMGTVWIEEERSYGKQDIERSNSIIRVRAYCNGASAPSTFPGQVCFPGPSMFPELRMFPGLPNYPRRVSRIAGHTGLAG